MSSNQVEIWVRAIAFGDEIGRVYVTTVGKDAAQDAIQVYENQGCRRILAFKECFRYHDGVLYECIIVAAK